MKNNSGFTLMELMTVIAIIAILSAVAVPNMISWRANHQLSGSAREVMSAVNGARVEAIKENSTVTVVVDPGAKKVESSYVNRLTGVSPAPKTTELKPDISVSTNFTNNSFRFNSRGLPINIDNNNFASGTIVLSDSRGKMLNVLMASTGITRIEKP